jgi:hypothetical protein
MPTRTVLPLTTLRFEGANEDLEDLVARIDAPLLDHLNITLFFFYEDILDTPQLLRFISHIPTLRVPNEAHIGMHTDNSNAWIKFIYSTRVSSSLFRLKIASFEPAEAFPFLVQFCRSPFFPPPTLEYLYICGGQYSLAYPRVDTRWLELLQPFTAVKNLYLSKEYAPHIAPVLQKLVEDRAMEVLPTLENVFLEGFRSSGPDIRQFASERHIRQFASARQLSGHPIVISHWDGTGSERDVDDW